MGIGGGWVLWAGLLLYIVLIAVALLAAYWVLRKAIAHGIRDARRADPRERPES